MVIVVEYVHTLASHFVDLKLIAFITYENVYVMNFGKCLAVVGKTLKVDRACTGRELLYLTAVVGELSVLAVGKIVESAVTQIVTGGTGKCKTVDGRELCKPLAVEHVIKILRLVIDESTGRITSGEERT